MTPSWPLDRRLLRAGVHRRRTVADAVGCRRSGAVRRSVGMERKRRVPFRFRPGPADRRAGHPPRPTLCRTGPHPIQAQLTTILGSWPPSQCRSPTKEPMISAGRPAIPRAAAKRSAGIRRPNVTCGVQSPGARVRHRSGMQMRHARQQPGLRVQQQQFGAGHNQPCQHRRRTAEHQRRTHPAGQRKLGQ